MIAQHAWSLATGTRSLPPDSPGPYFQLLPHERGQTLEGMPGDMDLPVGPPHAGILPSSLQNFRDLQGKPIQIDFPTYPPVSLNITRGA